MDISLSKTYLLAIAALALSGVASDRAFASDRPIILKQTVLQGQESLSYRERIAPDSSPTVTAPSEPAFYTQSITSPALPSEAPLADPLSDDFLAPENAPSAQDSEALDDEVGDIRPLPAPRKTPPPQPAGQILIRSTTFTSSNVTGNEATTEGDIVFVNGATLLVTPKLGPTTRLIATAGGGLTRFATEGDNNYNSLDFSLGIQQRFDEKTYGQIGWVNNQLYSLETGDRTLSDNSIRLLVGRQDQLNKQLRLDTAYELRARSTDPDDRSRISNTLGTRLRYDLSPNWQSSLGYRLAFIEYTQNGRSDTTHQFQATTTYTPTKDTFITGFAAYSLGRSSETTVDLDNLSFGIGAGINLPLF